MADELRTNIQSSLVQNAENVINFYNQTDNVINEIESNDIPILERMYNTKMKFIQLNQPALGNEIPGMGWFKLV